MEAHKIKCIPQNPPNAVSNLGELARNTKSGLFSEFLNSGKPWPPPPKQREPAP